MTPTATVGTPATGTETLEVPPTDTATPGTPVNIQLLSPTPTEFDGAQVNTYREYLDPGLREEFDAWRASLVFARPGNHGVVSFAVYPEGSGTAGGGKKPQRLSSGTGTISR